MSLLNSALIITAIGMGLVFLAIIALWGMMELLVRVTARFARREESEAGEEVVTETETEPTVASGAADAKAVLKRKAAAAAVVLALAQQNEQPIFSQMPTHASASPWQAVSRGGQLTQNASLYNRKSRGR